MFVALGIELIKRMLLIVICGLSDCTKFFHIISKNGTIFEKKVTGHKKCVLIFSTNLCEKFLVLRRIKPDMIKIWSLTLREEHRLRMFENRVLRRIFRPKRDRVTGEWKRIT